MSYLSKVLRDGEQVLASSRLHWIVFGRAAAIGAAALIVLLIGASQPSGMTRIVVNDLAAVLLVLTPFYALAAFIAWYTTEIAVTDRRVIYKRGLFSRRTVEMNISKVETVDVNQGPLGRLMDFGDVVVRGTGGSFEPLRAVGRPLALRNAILVG